MNATYYPCWCSHCLSLPPTFPFRFSTIGTPLRVQVWGRTTEKHTKVGIETSARVDSVVFWFILSCCVTILHHLLYLRRLPHSFIQVWAAPQRVAANMWVHTCNCVCLIGIVSISKRPDSHLPSLWIHVKQRQGEARQVDGCVEEPWIICAHSVRDTVNVFALRGATCSAYKHKRWLN